MISTLLQGSTVEWLARRLGVTTSEPALPRPLIETGTVRRLGAEIVEYPVGPDDAIVGQLVRELGLPRDALLSVIVRGEEALLPRGSTRIEADDRLHVMVREEVAGEMPDLLERWRIGPVGVPPRAHEPHCAPARPCSPRARGRRRTATPASRRRCEGVPVAEQIRTRRDTPRRARRAGGRPLRGDRAAAGDSAGPLQLQRYARRRLTGGGRRRARVVAGGHRRARALSGPRQTSRRSGTLRRPSGQQGEWFKWSESSEVGDRDFRFGATGTLLMVVIAIAFAIFS